MFQASLRYGIQQATQIEVEQVVGQIRRALADPRCTIEVKSGQNVQTATPDMPLRELLPQKTEDMQITVSQPHATG